MTCCFDKSRALAQQARRVIPGGAHSSMRAGADPPLFFERAQGAYIYDADGNRYIDYKMGAGPLILGHSPAPVIAAVKRQLEQGLQSATETPLGNEVASRFVELVPCADMVRFTNTGSEAVHLALRLARAYRSRPKIVCFEGHFHGWFDNIWTTYSTGDDAFVAASAGQDRGIENIAILPWNDLDVLGDFVAANHDQVAGIIMTPMMLGAAPGGALARPDYLQGARDLCTRHEIVLIFDEILTGFRVALGGAQELLGVVPDLAVYAKAMAAGISLAALAGRGPFMELIASGHVQHPGTYNGNVIALAAAQAALEELSGDDGNFFRYCNALRQRLSEGIEQASQRHGIPICLHGAGAVLHLWISSNPNYHDFRTAMAGHDAGRQQRFHRDLLDHGILSNSTFFLTSAHTDTDIRTTIEAIDRVLEALN